MAKKIITFCVSLTLVLGQCSQSSTEQTKEMRYFDQDGEILLKLYRKSEQGVDYWETWNTDKKTATVHWGKLGTTGQAGTLVGQSVSDFRDKLTKLIDAKFEEGYDEILYHDQFTLAISFTLQTWSTVEDLDRREEIRNIVTDNLGWTGNGRCDDGDIGSGEMTLYADVIDPYIAASTVKKELAEKKITDQPRFDILQGEDVIHKDYNPDK